MIEIGDYITGEGFGKMMDGKVIDIGLYFGKTPSYLIETSSGKREVVKQKGAILLPKGEVSYG